MATRVVPRGRRRGCAVALAVVAGLALATAAVGCMLLGWSWAEALAAFVVSNAVMGLAFGSCGLVLAWHRPANAIGWLFLVGGTLQAVAAAAPPVLDVLASAGAPTAALRLVVTVFVYSWPWAIGLCIPLALLLFPDGRPASPGWRWVVVVVAASAPLFVLQMGAAPEPVSDEAPVGHLTITGYDGLEPLWTAAAARTLAAYVLALVALVVRYRRATEAARRQLLWLVLALVVVIPVFLVWELVAGAPVAVLLCVPLIPVAVTLAVVRHNLLDIELYLSRALAWLVLSLLVVAAYAGLVALLDHLLAAFMDRSALVTVLLVLLAAPTLPRVQRLVDRALYGDRSDPGRVVSVLGEHFATPDTGLSGVVASLRHSLRFPWLALTGDDGVLVREGRRPDRVATLPLTYACHQVGTLEVGLREGERQLATADRRTLDLLSAPLAVALHATVLSVELQASRERLVGAREEERRRLRRELHDELGPALTGIALTADAAANEVAGDKGCSPLAAELLHTLRRDARTALADVRRVVEDLRPPVLDELGLVEALRQRADRVTLRADGARMQVRLNLPDPVPALPAAVEVAAYRVATEALTNVVRHSRGGTVEVTLRCKGTLEVLVTDDGPTSGPWSPGTGLQSMRERVTELGGAFVAGPSPAGGRVHACLPLGAP